MRKRSKYDEFYELHGEIATCKTCAKKYTWNSTTGTNSLKAHLASAHPDLLEKLINEDAAAKRKKEEASEERKQKSIIPFPVVSKVSVKVPFKIDNNKEDGLKWTKDGYMTQKIDKAIIRMICRDHMPLRTVEREGFRNLMAVTAPQFKLKSRNYFGSKALPELTQFIEEKVSEDLKAMRYISITSDGWTSPDSKHCLLSVTGHWLDENTMEPKYAVLSAKPVKGKHTSANFKPLVEETLSKFNIEKSQLVAMTRDGAPNMETLCKIMSLDSIHCFNHLLQLCVRDTLYSEAQVLDLLEKLKKITRKVRKSNVCREKFEKILDENSLPNRILLKETVVRWNSLHAMMESFLSLKLAVDVLTVTETDLKLPRIQDSEWELMSVLHNVLDPIAITMKTLQSRTFAPASLIIPTICILTERMQEKANALRDVDRITSDYIELFLAQFNIRTSPLKSNVLLKSCTFVDPRFKNSFFQESHKDFILNELRVFEKTPKTKPISDEEVIEDEISDFDRFARKNTQNSGRKLDEVEEELDEYLLAYQSSNLNPTTWWNTNERKFPRIKTLALRYLSIPATSSESERLFSASGLICSPKRNKMKSSTLEQLVFNHCNLLVYGVSI